MYVFSMEQFVSNFDLTAPFQWKIDKLKNCSPGLNVNYKQFKQIYINNIVTRVW